MSTGYQFAAGNPFHPLMGYAYNVQDQNFVWQSEHAALAYRGLMLWCNDDFAQALLDTKQTGIFGSEGLRFRSLYEIDGKPNTSEAEYAIRYQIEDAIERAGLRRGIDARRLLARVEFEKTIDAIASIKGDCFAVRCWHRNRRNATHATCWRIIQPERVSNPDGRPNSKKLQDGLRIGPNGDVIGIYVEKSSTGDFGERLYDREHTYVPWFADDGTPNVIHRTGLRVAGSPRGFSMYSAQMVRMRQLAGTVEAYVAGKRASAMHIAVIKTDDPKELAEAERQGAKLGPNTVLKPVSFLYDNADHEIEFHNPQFDGSDFAQFMEANQQQLCAAWGYPYEVVTKRLGKASLASARASLDQANRKSREHQNDHIEQCTSVINESIVREEVGRNRIVVATGDWSRIMKGRYQRPPRHSTDIRHDSAAAKDQIAIGRAPSNVFADLGWDYQAEREEAKRNAEFDAGLGMEPANSTAEAEQ